MQTQGWRLGGGRRWGLLAALTVLLAGLCSEAVAQGRSGPTGPGSSSARMIGQEKKVGVVTSSGQKIILFPVVVPEGIKSGTDASAFIPWAEVRKIRVLRRATMTGMWIGCGVGAVIGGLGGLAWVSENGDLNASGIPLLILLCGAGGALDGAIIGTFCHDWRTVYRGPDAPAPALRVSLAPTRGGGAMTLTVAF
jgi:hypothetical protein